MKPWLLALLGLFLVVGAIAADTVLLTETIIRNGYWTYALLGPAFLLALAALFKKRSFVTVSAFVLSFALVGIYTGSRFLPVPTEPPKVGVGDSFPNFSLKNEDGKTVSLSSIRKQGPVVLVLFRGEW